MRYSNKNLNNELTIKDIKQDEMFTLKNIEEPTGKQVWLKSHYDRSTRKFVIYNFSDIGKSKFEVLDYMQISKRLSPIPDDERKNIINPLIRKYGYITDSISLKYDPNAITFYSQYDKKRPRGKRVVIGYPTFTRYMVYWKPALEAAFRHELGSSSLV